MFSRGVFFRRALLGGMSKNDLTKSCSCRGLQEGRNGITSPDDEVPKSHCVLQEIFNISFQGVTVLVEKLNVRNNSFQRCR
jgi:hypothetical protein